MEGGEVFPLYRVLADVGEFAAGQVLECGEIDPLKGAVLALQKSDRVRLLVASFGEELALKLSIPESFRMAAGSRFTSEGVHPVNPFNLPLVLAPFSIVRLDFESEGGAHP